MESVYASDFSPRFWGHESWPFLFAVIGDWFRKGEYHRIVQLVRFLPFLLPCETCARCFSNLLAQSPIEQHTRNPKDWLLFVRDTIHARLTKENKSKADERARHVLRNKQLAEIFDTRNVDMDDIRQFIHFVLATYTKKKTPGRQEHIQTFLSKCLPAMFFLEENPNTLQWWSLQEHKESLLSWHGLFVADPSIDGILDQHRLYLNGRDSVCHGEYCS